MKKTIIILIAALAALGILLLKNKRDQAATQADTFALDSTKMETMESIQVVKSPDTSLVTLKNGKWVVPPDNWPADTAKVNKVLRTVFTLQNKDMVSNNPKRLSEYGLDSSEAKLLTVKSGNGKAAHQVVIGKTSGIDYNSTYWKWKEDPKVYRTPGNFAWEISTKVDEWKDKKIFNFDPKDIKEIDVTWKDTTGLAHSYKLESGAEESWKMLQPKQGAALKTDVDAITSRIGEMSIDEFITSDDSNSAKADMENPELLANIKLKEGAIHQLKVGKTLDGYSYTMHPAQKKLVKVSSWRMDVFKKTADELWTPMPVDTTKVDNVSVAPENTAALDSLPSKTSK